MGYRPPLESSGGGGGGGGLLKVATVVLTQAQLLANGDTPVVIVPAPGAGNVAFPIATRAKLTFVSHPYSEAFTQGPYLWWENSANAIGPVLYPLLPSGSQNFSYDIVASASSTVATYISGLTANPAGGFDPNAYTNQPIVLQVGSGETMNCGTLLSVAITTPGTGWTVGDLLQTVGSSGVNNSILQVSSVSGGGITGISISDAEPDVSGTATSRAQGNLSSSTLQSGGALYAVGDTGNVTGEGDGSATYTVDTVDGGGAVLTYTIDPNTGSGYLPGTDISTTAGGDQPGVGTGFTVDVLSGGGTGAVFDLTVQVGDGTLTVTVWYTVAPA